MDPTLRQFRVTVAVVLAFEAVLFVCGYYNLFPRPSGSLGAFAWDMYGSILKRRYIEGSDWLWYFLHIGSLVGLLLLSRPARYFATVALLHGVLSISWSGVRVSAPLDSFIQQVAFVLYLFALYMAYFGKAISGFFGPVASNSAAHGT